MIVNNDDGYVCTNNKTVAHRIAFLEAENNKLGKQLELARSQSTVNPMEAHDRLSLSRLSGTTLLRMNFKRQLSSKFDTKQCSQL